MHKVCTKCKESKLATTEHFYRMGDGFQTRCKVCQSNYSKDWYLRNIKEQRTKSRQYYYEHKEEMIKKAIKYQEGYKSEWLNIVEDYFKEVVCFRCGYNECFAALEFHHVDPSTKDGVITDLLRKKPTEERIAKLKGTMILCANCHRHIHNGGTL
jgi:predicted nucleic-acid-binding Zn-ribbon protein